MKRKYTSNLLLIFVTFTFVHSIVLKVKIIGNEALTTDTHNELDIVVIGSFKNMPVTLPENQKDVSKNSNDLNYGALVRILVNGNEFSSSEYWCPDTIHITAGNLVYFYQVQPSQCYNVGTCIKRSTTLPLSEYTLANAPAETAICKSTTTTTTTPIIVIPPTTVAPTGISSGAVAGIAVFFSLLLIGLIILLLIFCFVPSCHRRFTICCKKNCKCCYVDEEAEKQKLIEEEKKREKLRLEEEERKKLKEEEEKRKLQIVQEEKRRLEEERKRKLDEERRKLDEEKRKLEEEKRKEREAAERLRRALEAIDNDPNMDQEEKDIRKRCLIEGIDPDELLEEMRRNKALLLQILFETRCAHEIFFPTKHDGYNIENRKIVFGKVLNRVKLRADIVLTKKFLEKRKRKRRKKKKPQEKGKEESNTSLKEPEKSDDESQIERTELIEDGLQEIIEEEMKNDEEMKETIEKLKTELRKKLPQKKKYRMSKFRSTLPPKKIDIRSSPFYSDSFRKTPSPTRNPPKKVMLKRSSTETLTHRMDEDDENENRLSNRQIQQKPPNEIRTITETKLNAVKLRKTIDQPIVHKHHKPPHRLRKKRKDINQKLSNYESKYKIKMENGNFMSGINNTLNTNSDSSISIEKIDNPKSLYEQQTTTGDSGNVSYIDLDNKSIAKTSLPPQKIDYSTIIDNDRKFSTSTFNEIVIDEERKVTKKENEEKKERDQESPEVIFEHKQSNKARFYRQATQTNFIIKKK
ncbi:hypothetical protein SNEBB_005709 [Seison nebaliae]|nr:hypothetical protein SNEBB_005709 [Seison nebaliae]